MTAEKKNPLEMTLPMFFNHCRRIAYFVRDTSITSSAEMDFYDVHLKIKVLIEKSPATVKTDSTARRA